MVVINKTDVRKLSQLTPSEKILIDSMLTDGVELMEMSTHLMEGVFQVKETVSSFKFHLPIDL
jgi:hypothetical protein